MPSFEFEILGIKRFRSRVLYFNEVITIAKCIREFKVLIKYKMYFCKQFFYMFKQKSDRKEITQIKEVYMFKKCNYERKVTRGYLSELESFSGKKADRDFIIK